MSGEQILVVIDPTADVHPSVARASWLAKAWGAPIHLFICDYDQSLASEPHFDKQRVEKARREVLDQRLAMLEQLAAPLRAEGREVTTEAVWGRPIHRGILQKVGAAPPRIVVKDTYHHPVLRRMLLSNTDWNLIRACPAPLLLVKPGELRAQPQILATVDPLHEHDKPAALDRAILSFATDLAAKTGARLDVLHAFDIGPALALAAGTIPTGAVPIAEIRESMESTHRTALENLLSGFSIPPDRVHLAEGVPHDCIVAAAEELEADIVVMGAVSRSGLKRIFVGHTAERTLDRLDCDLIVVKPPGFSAPSQD